MAGRAFIGTSGYSYPHWRGIFYPQGLRTSEWLQYYSWHFQTVELNNPFYRLPTASAFEGWRKGTPPGFVFAVKASRFITHIKRLKDPEVSVGLFLERASGLREKLGPVLFQLPPSWPFNASRLEGLLRYLRRQSIVRRLRAALEVRHKSWLDSKAFTLLEEAGVALCFADWPDLPVEGPVTADFVYLRRHGPASLYSSSYSEEALAEEARKMKGWLKKGLDVYIYYNNDAYGYAIENALRLKALITSSP
ncbi:MAG: DUF72 domain-containing protein [Candidatus Methylomirabilales bacterium]